MSAVLGRPIALGGPGDLKSGSSAELVDGPPSSAGFSALLAEHRSVGGAIPGDGHARLLKEHQRGNFVSLARLTAAREVFGFKWRGAFSIPMFQFEPLDLSVVPSARQVLAELSEVLDGWELATWFARSNDRIDGRRPVDLLTPDLPAVLATARLDRFVAAG
jgi:hypothetical protein